MINSKVSCPKCPSDKVWKILKVYNKEGKQMYECFYCGHVFEESEGRLI